ncbi:hypothetical protein OROMI_011798 [Orobanche minor]
MSRRRIQNDVAGDPPPQFDDEETLIDDSADESGILRLRPSNSNVTDDLEPFMGVEARRKASRHRDYIGDYLDVQSRNKCDGKVLFADKVLKFTGSGKMKRRILLITDFAIYVVDPNSDVLKRRIALAAVKKLCLSELSDNFFAIIIPTEYDLLMASTRKTEIVTVLADATKSASDYELEVFLSNRFEYNAAAKVVKEVQFEEAEGWFLHFSGLSMPLCFCDA